MTYTLSADGPSDKVLMPLISWSLRRYGIAAVSEQWVDFSRVPTRPRVLRDRLRVALDLFPCDVLFVHRDAEAQEPERRRAEIRDALEGVPTPHVPVIPVRMTEAWLLGSERAIRAAAGNPNGVENIDLPEIRRLERLTDPKALLLQALSNASGLGARRRAQIPLESRVARIPAYIDDFSFLDALPSFAALQRDIQAAITSRSGT